MELMGTVRNGVDFGAFVDIGVKNDGLVHISQMSKKFIKHPMDAVSVGDTVKVKIINSYSNEKPGMGWYLLKTNLGTEYRFEEIENAGTDNSCLIYDPNYPAENIGSHTGQLVSIDLRRYEFDTATLECYWAMENEGILSIGAEDGLRQLYEISVTKVK
jgi:hypothetical protein